MATSCLGASSDTTRKSTIYFVNPATGVSVHSIATTVRGAPGWAGLAPRLDKGDFLGCVATGSNTGNLKIYKISYQPSATLLVGSTIALSAEQLSAATHAMDAYRIIMGAFAGLSAIWRIDGGVRTEILAACRLHRSAAPISGGFRGVDNRTRPGDIPHLIKFWALTLDLGIGRQAVCVTVDATTGQANQLNIGDTGDE